MKIRTAVKNDKEALFRLWREAFGDGDEVIEHFFDTVIEYENTVVAEIDGEAVSALYLIPAEISHENKLYSAYYVYAAATLKSFRKRGIMAKLLEFADSLAEHRSIDYLFLHPAEEYLYAYYAKNGYETAFYEKEDTFDGDFVKWSEEVIELDRWLGEGESDENGFDNNSRKTGMIKRINADAPIIDNAYLGITLE